MFAGVKFWSRLLTALNFEPSISNHRIAEQAQAPAEQHELPAHAA
jgi:hypothetical protein